MHIGSVVIDCNDLRRMLAFWQAALGYVPREQPEDDWAVLVDPSAAHVNVSLQKVPEPRVGKNRLHLDLYADNADGEVERLTGLGAREHPRGRRSDEDFIAMLDPEGNVFDIVRKPGVNTATAERR